MFFAESGFVYGKCGKEPNGPGVAHTFLKFIAPFPSAALCPSLEHLPIFSGKTGSYFYYNSFSLFNLGLLLYGVFVSVISFSICFL